MGHLGPRMDQNEVLGHFLIKNALDFANIVYHDWEWQYLVPYSGEGVEKKFAGPKMGQLGATKGQNGVLGHFLTKNALVFCDFAYPD